MSALTLHNFSNLSFGFECFSRGTRGRNTLPGSTSFHSGEAKAPVYLMIRAVPCCGGAPLADTQKLCRTSRSSKILVPCRGMRSSPNSQIEVMHDEPEST